MSSSRRTSSHKKRISYPRAKAPDHWSRNPRTADMKIADELVEFHRNERAPGGSSQGINPTRKKSVIGVVFHINLFDGLKLANYSLIQTRSTCWYQWNSSKLQFRKNTYARAVQLYCCCRFDHRILLTALGIIHANAMQAPNKLNSRSVTVATATPADTIVKASTCKVQHRSVTTWATYL